MPKASIVDVGRFLKRYGLSVGENPAFGGVTQGAHAPNSFHYHGEAIDVTDWRKDQAPEYEGGPVLGWQQRTANLAKRAKELGVFAEALGPGDRGHDTHVHLAFSGSKPITPDALEYLATGRRKGGGAPAVGGGQAPTLEARQQALLDTISWAEGTWDPKRGRQYDIAYTGARFDPSKGHPRQLRGGNGSPTSDAAGAFQFLSTTWDETAKRAGLKDFSPASQDQAALLRVRDRAGDLFEKEGLSDRVIGKLGGEWASFPGGGYGQPVKTGDDLRKFYNQRLSARGVTDGGRNSGPPPAGGGDGGGDEITPEFVNSFLAQTQPRGIDLMGMARSILDWQPKRSSSFGLGNSMMPGVDSSPRFGLGDDFMERMMGGTQSRQRTLPNPMEILAQFGLV